LPFFKKYTIIDQNHKIGENMQKVNYLIVLNNFGITENNETYELHMLFEVGKELNAVIKHVIEKNTVSHFFRDDLDIKKTYTALYYHIIKDYLLNVK
jgi:hypothetical protein